MQRGRVGMRVLELLRAGPGGGAGRGGGGAGSGGCGMVRSMTSSSSFAGSWRRRAASWMRGWGALPLPGGGVASGPGGAGLGVPAEELRGAAERA
jgi:hypothetical protein